MPTKQDFFGTYYHIHQSPKYSTSARSESRQKKRDEWNECERRRIDIKAVNNSIPLFPQSRQCCLFYIHLSVVHLYEDVQLSS